jgi:DNA-binding NarL/FixJ family response regulator
MGLRPKGWSRVVKRFDPFRDIDRLDRAVHARVDRDAASGAGAVGDPLVISHPERVRQLRPLPPRLRQVQALARAGFTVPETARALGISINTVKQYRALLLRRGGLP